MEEKEVRLMFKVLALFAGILFAGSATAQVTCSVTGWTTDRGSLTASAGTRSTKGPTIVVIPECQDSSGWYVNLPGFIPLFSKEGREVDLRAGWRGEVKDGIRADLSVAYYQIWAADGTPIGVFNAAGAVTRRFELATGVGYAPYAKLDYTHGTRIVRGDSLALGIGGVLDWKLPVLGDPTLVVDGSIWFRPVQTQKPGRGPIEALDLSLNFPVGSATVGPYVLITHGSVNEPKKKGVETIFGLRFTVPLI